MNVHNHVGNLKGVCMHCGVPLVFKNGRSSGAVMYERKARDKRGRFIKRLFG